MKFHIKEYLFPVRHSIRFKIISLLFILFLAVILIQVLIITPYLLDKMIKSEIGNQDYLARLLSSYLDYHFNKGKKEIEAIAKSPQLQALQKNKMDSYLSEQARISQFFNYFFILDREGHWISYPDQPHLIGKSILKQNWNWFETCINKKKTVYLDTIQTRIKTLVSGFATPVINREGKVIAVIRGVFKLSGSQGIPAAIRASLHNENAYAYLVSANGSLLAHPFVLINYKNFHHYDYSQYEPVKQLMQGKNGLCEYQYENKNWIASFYPVRTTNWGLVIHQPKQDILHRSRFFVHPMLFLFSLAFCLAITLMVLIIHRFLRPLNQVMDNIRNGKYKQKGLAYGNDESGVLALQFHQLYLDLQKNRERFQAITEITSDWIWEIDKKGCFSYSNPKVFDLIGYQALEILGKDPFDLMTEDCRQQIKPQFQKVWSEGKDIPVVQLEFIHKDGSIRHIESSGIYLKNEDAQYRGINRDITQRLQMNEKLRQSEKMTAIGELAGGIAHDFNNQLAGIMGFAEIISDNLDKKSELYLYSMKIITQVERAGSLTRQLLAFARKGKYQQIIINLHSLIEEVITILERSLPKSIEMKRELEAEKPFCLGDPGQLQNVLINLGINARDAMPQGGELVFKSQNIYLDTNFCRKSPFEIEEGDFIKITVKDKGTGIPKEILPRIFDPFFTTKEQGKGTGMGLAAVYGTIKNHSGALEVESQPGKGSCFYLYLAKVKEEPINEAPKKNITNKQILRVLIIDDEISVLESISLLLDRQKAKSLVFSDPIAGLSHFKKNPLDFDLLILDLQMPKLQGEEFYQEIRKIQPQLPVLFISGFQAQKDVLLLLKDKNTAFIQKPFSRQQLNEMIEILMKKTNYT